MSTTTFTAVCYIICSYRYSHRRVFNNEHTYVILLPNHFRLVCGQCIFRYRMCKDDPCNHITLHFSNYDQCHHQFRWLTFDFPATEDISHMTCLLFAFEWVHHVVRSQQIKYLHLYFNVLVFEA
jgi:hypothetical protein